MKIQLHPAFLVVAAAAMCSCSVSESPEATVTQMYKAVEKGDDDAALRLVHPAAMQMLGVAKMRSRFEASRKRYSACGGIKTVATSVADGGTAEHKTVRATVSYGGSCQPHTENLPLSKVDGRWLIGV